MRHLSRPRLRVDDEGDDEEEDDEDDDKENEFISIRDDAEENEEKEGEANGKRQFNTAQADDSDSSPTWAAEQMKEIRKFLREHAQCTRQRVIEATHPDPLDVEDLELYEKYHEVMGLERLPRVDDEGENEEKMDEGLPMQEKSSTDDSSRTWTAEQCQLIGEHATRTRQKLIEAGHLDPLDVVITFEDQMRWLEEYQEMMGLERLPRVDDKGKNEENMDEGLPMQEESSNDECYPTLTAKQRKILREQREHIRQRLIQAGHRDPLDVTFEEHMRTQEEFEPLRRVNDELTGRATVCDASVDDGVVKVDLSRSSSSDNSGNDNEAIQDGDKEDNEDEEEEEEEGDEEESVSVDETEPVW